MSIFFSIYREIYVYSNTIIEILPGNLGKRVRKYYYSKFFKLYGKGAYICENVKIYGKREVSIGDRSGINTGGWMSATGGIEIGKDVLVGPNVVIHTGNHIFSDRSTPIKLQGEIFQKVVIGSDVWIGANVTILSGVTIGDGVVIGAGSVVIKDIPPYTIAVGNPARIVRER